jgi:hypothetical protein
MFSQESQARRLSFERHHGSAFSTIPAAVFCSERTSVSTSHFGTFLSFFIVVWGSPSSSRRSEMAFTTLSG